MAVTLNELKGYLRIDSNDDDGLLTDLISSSEKRCADILRIPENTALPDTSDVKIAVLYSASYLYEHREEADHNRLNLTLRALLFGDRGDVF